MTDYLTVNTYQIVHDGDDVIVRINSGDIRGVVLRMPRPIYEAMIAQIRAVSE